MLGAFIVYQAGAYYWYKTINREQVKIRVENTSVNLALQPMMLAERDRLYLKELKRIR